MAHGTYPLGSLLPSQRELAAEFEVSRDTVQRALRELSSEGRVESRQGAGTRVVRVVRAGQVQAPRARTATLRESLQRAFEQPEVTLDVFTLTCESLEVHLRLQAERIWAGEIAPQDIALRVLLPAESLSLPYWHTSDGVHDEVLRDRYLAMTRRHVAAVRSVLRNLEPNRLVPSVDVQIRRVSVVPHLKLYILNRVEVVLGPYVPHSRTIVVEDGREIENALDVTGLATGLTHFVKDWDSDSQDTASVNSWQNWFDATWDLLTDGNL
ncbi:winged helix-turn-helix transcriptional regulator [Streptomyces sp. S3(2020)]|nr:winged helix-turn-helix transcriptional regulator [Streptomyces sp. S3(2020)]